MLKWIFLSFCLLIGVLILKSCTTSKSQKEDETSRKFNHIVDAYFESYLKLNPLFATSIGDHRYDDQLTISISKEVRKQGLTLIQDALTQIEGVNQAYLSRQDLLTCEMFIEDLKAAEDLYKVDLGYLMPFDQMDSFFSGFASLASGSSYITFDTEIDYENFLKRAAIVPAYFDVMIQNMKEGIQMGVTTPKVLVSEALKQITALLVSDYKESVFYKPLLGIEKKVSEPACSVLKERYESMIQTSIYPAYQKLETFVREEYLPSARTTAGLSEIPGGRQYYLALVKAQTTTNWSPDQIMEVGFNEVDRIQKEFEAVKDELQFKGSLSEFYGSLREHTSKLYPFHTDEEVLNAYRSIEHKVMEKVPEYFRLMPKARFEIREVEKFQAGNTSEAYQNPSMDGSRPGIFWVPIPDPTKYPVKSMECIFLHEAIPGHHFQIAIQQELSLCPYRRFSGNNAYAEGWALYTESLGKDLGMYTDAYQWVGRLTMEMHRAVRLVVDTGIHWKGWSREKAIAYSMEKEPGDLSDITREVERYMAIPGQALSYKIGELAIQKLKKKAQEELKECYLDKDFHDEILQDGNLPLSVLDAKILRWIQSKKCQIK